MAEFRDFYEESEKMADYLLKAIDSSTLKKLSLNSAN